MECFSNTNLYKFKIAFNDVFRKLLKVGRREIIHADFVSYNIDYIMVRRRNSILSFI